MAQEPIGSHRQSKHLAMLELLVRAALLPGHSLLLQQVKMNSEDGEREREVRSSPRHLQLFKSPLYAGFDNVARESLIPL